MKRNRLWILTLEASVMGLLVFLAGCDSAGAGGTSGEANNDDTTSAPPEATLELLHDGSVLDGQTPVDYGTVLEGDTVSEVFTIRNSGSATANLTGAKVTVAGTYADD